MRRKLPPTVRGLRLVMLLLAAWPAAAKERALAKQVVVLVGMPGSGKSTWAPDLAKSMGVSSVIASGGIIRAEVEARGLPYTPANERAVAFEMARRPGAIGRLLAPRVHDLPDEVVVIEGLRSPTDVAELRRDRGNHVTIIAFDAPARVRHQRMLERDRTRYASPGGQFDAQSHLAYLRQRDVDELGRGVDHLIRSADFRVDTSGSMEAARAHVRALGELFSGTPPSLRSRLDLAAQHLPRREIEAMTRNPWVRPYLRDALVALAEIADRPGALGLIRRIGRSRTDGNALGGAYEAWAARSFGKNAAAVAVIHRGNEADVVLKDGRIVEAKSGSPSFDVLRQLRARAQGGTGVVVVSGREPKQDVVRWFREHGAAEFPAGYELIHMPLGGKPRVVLGAKLRVRLSRAASTVPRVTRPVRMAIGRIARRTAQVAPRGFARTDGRQRPRRNQ